MSNFLTFFITNLAAAGILVGNGGEGAIDGKQIYVRDLYDAGIHLSPYFGEKADDQWLTWFQKSKLNKLSISKNLLAKKLTDINSIEPQLGSWVSQAIDQYNWVLTDKELNLLLDDAPIRKNSENSRVQIANRDLTTIRLNTKSWNTLSDNHKIALVIHEALFSMTKPECKNPPSCTEFFQASRVAREIVSTLFKKDGKLDRWMKEAIGLPKDKENFIATSTDRAGYVAVTKTYETAYGKQITVEFEPRTSSNNRNSNKGPLAESLAACKNKKKGDFCEFKLENFHEFKGNCWSPKSELPLACRPPPTP